MTTTRQDLTYGQMRQLTARLNPKRISKRSQGGRQLSFLEAWDVRTALIRIFGFGGYSATVTDAQIVQFERDIPKRDGGVTAFRVTAMCRLRLYIPQLDATYEEAAVASQAGADPGEVADFAIKTAESDALKRCAMNLGTQFGLSLYDNGSTEDVVRLVLAPGQEWPRPEFEDLGEKPPESYQTDAKAPNPEGVALVNRALKMAEDRDNARAAQQEDVEEGDVPMALDSSLEDGREAEAVEQ